MVVKRIGYMVLWRELWFPDIISEASVILSSSEGGGEASEDEADVPTEDRRGTR